MEWLRLDSAFILVPPTCNISEYRPFISSMTDPIDSGSLDVKVCDSDHPLSTTHECVDQYAVPELYRPTEGPV
jgi:hypothetical protein